MRVNPNINSRVIDPLTVTKPAFVDPSIEDLYLDPAEIVYEYGAGYKQQYDVVLVKRITADMVRKFRCSFCSRHEATAFMFSLCSVVDAETQMQSTIATVASTIPPNQGKKRTVDDLSIKKPVFSFYDD